MQFIVKKLLWLFLIGFPFLTIAQSTYLPQGHKHQQFLDRLEIKLQRYGDLNLFTAKPLSRKIAVLAAEYGDSVNQAQPGFLSAVDQHNLQSLLMNNSEWVTGDKSSFNSKKSVWKTFYRTKANLFEVDEPGFFLAVNPVIQQQQSVESDNDERVFLNSKGLNFRGLVSGKIGFSGYITDNQERGPMFMMNRVNKFMAVPGAGFYKPFKTTALDYFDARGSINFSAAKVIDFQFGYDKNFIGNGYRSLLMSDYANSYLFLKVNLKVWKLNYQNLFMELTPQYIKGGPDQLQDKKYAAMHHLSINATPWLNVGIFEAVLFGRENHFDFTYLNPIMFLRVAEQQNGSADNAIVGLDLKANVAKRLQFYWTLVLDEFLLKELKAQDGWWGNKYAMQFGGKYIDVFGVKNLDIQGEFNFARPFTYSHHDSVSNHSHYNQPLSHPLGANFLEAIGIIRYQPHPKWTTSARLILWKQGVDTGTANFGSNIFKLNTTRSGDYGFDLPAGPISNGLNGQLLISWEPKENLFFDASLLVRKLTALGNADKTSVFTIAVRINMFRREYDY